MLPRLQPLEEPSVGSGGGSRLRSGGALHSARGAAHGAVAGGGLSALVNAQQPQTARGPREDASEQLLPHEETVRAVYKRHAQSFFEDIKEGFLKEAAALRKQAQKALVRATGHHVDDHEPAEAGGGRAGDLRRQHQVVAALAAKLEKQNEELQSLSRHVHAESSSAKKAVLTPVWKERALHDIAKAELRNVCAEEVRHAFKDLANSFDDQRVEATVTRLSEAGRLPWETALREEIKELLAPVHRQLTELSLRADESTAARAVLVDCCNALEERQRAAAKRFDALQVDLREFRDEWATSRTSDKEAASTRSKALDTSVADLAERITKETTARIEGLAGLRAGVSDLGTQLEAVDNLLKDNASRISEATEKAQEGCRLARDAKDEAQTAKNEASRTGVVAAHARSEGEAARGLASGAVEAIVRNEATIARLSVKIGALEGNHEELQRQLRHHVEAAESRAQRLTDGAQLHEDRLKLLEAQGCAAPASPRPASAPSAADAGTGAMGESGDTNDAIYAAAKLRAHLDFVEARIKELQRHSDTLGDEIAARARRATDTTTQHTARLEALELRVGEMHRHTTTLSGEVGAHGRRLVDTSSQHASRVEALEDRLRGLDLHITALGNDVGLRVKRLADQVTDQAEIVRSLDDRGTDWARQVRQCGSEVARCSSHADRALAETVNFAAHVSGAKASEEALRRDLASLASRVQTLELRQTGTYQDVRGSIYSASRPPPVQSQRPPASHPVNPMGGSPPSEANTLVALKQRIAGFLLEAQESGSLEEAVRLMLQKEEEDEIAQKQASSSKVSPPSDIAGCSQASPDQNNLSTDGHVGLGSMESPSALGELDAMEERPCDADSVSRMSMSSSHSAVSLADEVSGRVIASYLFTGEAPQD